MAQALFVTTEDIKKFTALNGNVDPDKFIQFVKISQDTHIQEYLGTRLFVKINDDIVSDDLAEPYTSLLTTYIKPMVIHWALYEYLPFASYQIANKGIYKGGSETSETVSKEEVDYLINKQQSIAQHYTTRFKDYMCFNQASFPEYYENANGDMFPNQNTINYGWYL